MDDAFCDFDWPWEVAEGVILLLFLYLVVSEPIVGSGWARFL